jgi:hypothetical protein
MLRGIDGSEATRLWGGYCSGNENDINTLLKYNREISKGCGRSSST